MEGQAFAKPAFELVKQLVMNPSKHQPVDNDAVAANMKQLELVLDVYEQQLCTRPYIAGQAFSMADIGHMPFMGLLVDALSPTEGVFDIRPHVLDWWWRLSKRLSWHKVNQP